MARKRSRLWITIGVGISLAAALTYAFWPRPQMVDMGQAVRGPMMITIEEEARTRVRENYVVAAPITGRLLRVGLKAGDVVKKGTTTVARILPSAPPALNIRERQQAEASVRTAEAALRRAQADLESARADRALAAAELERVRTLRGNQAVSQSSLDQAERALQTANAAVEAAVAQISMRESELASARAALIGYDEARENGETGTEIIQIKAPISGRVLRVLEKSEAVVTAGTPILEFGNTENDLEIMAELLSSDAVKVAPGDRVIITNWGNPEPLEGIVERINPSGFTKVSALGVEEQRVNTIIGFTGPRERRKPLGHGFRVEVQIVIWEEGEALTVPASALFRQENDGWGIFVVEDGHARLRLVEVGRNNGIQAQILDGVTAGEAVILYPGPELKDGALVESRSVD